MAATAAIAGAVGAAASNIGSTVYTTERNIANSNWQAELNRDFQKEMASTQYQRAVSDMKAAGLNPAAIGAGMSPNSAAAGSAAMGNYGHGTDFGNIFSTAAKAAMASDRNVANKIIQEMKSETALGVQALKNEGMQANEVQKKELGHSSYSNAKAGFEDYQKNYVKFDEL